MGHPISFAACSARAQVRRLRALAVQAVRQFPVQVQKLEFLQHGENATFKVLAQNNATYLLRLHRENYHSGAGIREELAWLRRLAKLGMEIQVPQRSRRGAFLIRVEHPLVGVRYADLLSWVEGRFLSKSIREAHLFEIGALLARLQRSGKKLPHRNRPSWGAEGLVGANPHFGSFDRLLILSAREQAQLAAARRAILGKLKRYEQKHPQKMGLIHADLHFGNLLQAKSGRLVPIDFDDCGYGFLVYDLVIPLVGLEPHLRRHRRFSHYPRCKEALLAGYASEAEFDDRDRVLLQHLILARKMLMVGWLQSRSDHPELRRRLKTYARKTLAYIEHPYL